MTSSLTQDWYKPGFFADPYPFYCALRETDPVHWSPELNGWVVTSYEYVNSILRMHEVFSSAGRMAALLDTLPEAERAEFQPIYDHFAVGLIRSDPPDHMRLRRLISAVFTPRMIQRSSAKIEQIIDSLVSGFPSEGIIDLVREFAFPLPATVVCSILGVPAEDIHRVREWTHGINSIIAGNLPLREAAERMQAALVELQAYYRDMIARRRSSPGDDLMSLLVQAELEGDRLTEAELLSTAENLLAAGHETTTSLIGNAMWTLLNRPEELRKLREEPDLIPAAIEEVLRFESPLQRQTRVVKTETEFAGKLMKPGQLVFVMIGAANRDPEIFPDPDQFDIDRSGAKHIAFGIGIHFCIGAPLARMESHLALGTLLKRYPGIQVHADKIEWVPSAALRAPAKLPVLFT
jgi:cytochrome P450